MLKTQFLNIENVKIVKMGVTSFLIKIFDFIYKILTKPLIVLVFQIYYKFQKRYKIRKVRNPVFFKSARELVDDMKTRKV